MASQKRPAAARRSPAPPLTPPVNEELLRAAARHFELDPRDILAVATPTEDRAVIVTIDGRKLVWSEED